MSDLITLPDGKQVSYAQAMVLAGLTSDLGGKEKTHWHLNDCGCCVTLHGPDCAYVIARNGEATYYPERGCACEETTC